MTPFNLEAAKAGAPIQTRSGTLVRFVAHVPEAYAESRVVFVEPDGDISTCYEDGAFDRHRGETSLDLFMVETPHPEPAYVRTARMLREEADMIRSVYAVKDEDEDSRAGGYYYGMRYAADIVEREGRHTNA